MARNKNNQKNQNNQDTNQLLKVRRDKLSDLQANGKDPFKITAYDQTHHTEEAKSLYEVNEEKLLAGREPLNTEGMDEETERAAKKADYNERRAIMDADPVHVSIAGRMMFKRVMGKASFCNIQDLKGTIQIYVSKDSIGEDPYADFKKSDIGDIYGVTGYMFRTMTGEISIHAETMTLLSKSLQILPEKYHGMTNTDLRYRQRYVDLIMSPDVKEVFINRSRIISSIRRFLDAEGFIEVETPMLVSNAGGAAARPFETHFNALDEDLKLRISLELYLKRLIVGGMERVYEIGRVFRNEGLDTRHNPEFTLMELYQAYTDYNGMMDLTERMYRNIAQEVLGTTTIVYNGAEMDLGKPFERITMKEAVKKYAGVDWNEVDALEPEAALQKARELAKEHNVEFEERHKKGEILSLFFEEFAEEHMIQPTFVTDHPVEISPLTKKKPDDPEYVERFEFFMNGWEMANAYSELNDPIDQRERFKAQEEALAAGDMEANTTDEDFLNALDIGMPPTGGIGYGIDRLCMLMTDSAAIRDVLLFPTMKSLSSDKGAANAADGADGPATSTNDKIQDSLDAAKDAIEGAAKAGAAAAATISAELAARVEEKLQKLGVIDFSKVKIEPLFEEMVDFDTFSKSDFRAVKVKDCVAVPKSKKLLQFTLDDGTGTDRTILSGIHAYYEPEELIGKTCIAITNLPPRAMMGIDSCGMLLSAVHEEEGEEKLNLLMVDPHIPAGAKLY